MKLEKTINIVFILFALWLGSINVAVASVSPAKKNTVLWSLYKKAKSLKLKPDSAQFYLDSCFTYKELQTDEELLALCHLLQARVNITKQNYIEGIVNIQLCEDYFLNNNKKLEYASCKRLSGICKTNSADYKGSIEDLSVAGAIFDSLNILNKFYYVQNEIGNNFFYLSNIKYAKNKFEEAYEYAIQIKDTNMLSSTLNNLANVYSTSEMFDFDKSLLYYKKALKISKLTSDYDNMSIFLMNIAILYDEKQNFDSALYYYHTALKIATKHNLTYNTIWLMYNLGYMYYNLNNYDSAEYYIDKSLNNSIEIGYVSITPEIYNIKSQLYDKQKQYKKAFNSSQKALNLRDSIWRDDIIKSTAEIESKYRLQQKLDEIKLQKTQIKLQESQLYSQKVRTIGLLVATVLLLLFLIAKLFYSKKLEHKNKLLKEKNSVIKHNNSKLKDTISTRDRLISIIAHDIKNPLATIVGFAELISLSDSKKGFNKVKSYGSHILLSANNLFDLLDNLLKWAKKQKEGITLNHKNVNLYDLIESNLLLLKLSAETKNIKFTNNCNKKTLAYIDEQTINTVFRNLISNAIKFTEPGGDISISAENDDQYTILHIKDTGIGIKEEDIDKLFDAGIDRSSIGDLKNKGIGLGLILCHDFTTLNKGKIDIKSKYGNGSTFSIHLPLPK